MWGLKRYLLNHKAWTAFWGFTAIVMATIIGNVVSDYATRELNKWHETTPIEHRFGLAKNHTELAAPVVSQMPPFQITTTEVVPVRQANEKANVRFWRFVLAKQGKHLPNIPQQIGDCVSFGYTNGVNYLQFVTEGMEYHPAYPPYTYGASRVWVGKGQLGRADGSVGQWACQAGQHDGVLRADLDGVPVYSGQVAREWGLKGPPEKFRSEASLRLVKTYTAVRSADEVRDAICNGYPVTIASNWGGLMNPPVVDGRLVNRRSGSWSHQMCVIGYDGETGREPYFYILNSWGETIFPQPVDDSPPGGFWVRSKDMDYITSQEDSFAISSFDGFVEQELNFDLLGRREPQRASERNFALAP